MSPLPCAGAEYLPPPADSAQVASCTLLDFQIAGRLGHSWPEDSISTLFSLPRGRVEIGAATPHGGARLALEAVRSGGPGSALGVEGESLLARPQILAAALADPSRGVRLEAGLIDDPWVVTGESAWALREVAPVLGEREGWLDRSDLGAVVAWTAPRGFASAAAAMTTGEGARYAERNDGKDTTVLGVLRPLSGLDQPEALDIAGFFREGSRGLSSARDHRLGARIRGDLGPVSLGAEALKAWGVDADAAREPWGLSAWQRSALPLDLAAYARVDVTAESPGDPSSRAAVAYGGLAWRRGETQALLGAERAWAGDQAAPVAGAPLTGQELSIYAQISFSGRYELAYPETR